MVGVLNTRSILAARINEGGLVDLTSTIKPGTFDPRLNETVWTSMLVGDDYLEERDIEAWVQARYATEIALNDEIGFMPIEHAERIVRAGDKAPSFYSMSRTNVGNIPPVDERKGTDKRRNGRKQLHGWKHYADLRYRSA